MLALERADALLSPLHGVEIPAKRVALRDRVEECRSVFPLQPLEEREPLLHLLKPGGRCFNAVRIPAEEDREIVELRLDGVALLEVRLELPINGRQLTHTTPDTAQ